MDFLPKKIDDYAAKMTAEDNELLAKLTRETYLKVIGPRMLSGQIQGRFLSMISHMMKPKYILEIGTYTGYSALCLAEGLHPEGKLITIDRNNELEDILEKFLKKSPSLSADALVSLRGVGMR